MSAIDGYIEDSQGRLIPLDKVNDFDKERDAFVREQVACARAQQEALRSFKHQAMDDAFAFLELSAERYEAKLGGNKGNFQLMSFDGKLKVQVALQEYLEFDEGIYAAKALIDECLKEWSRDSRDEIQVLVQDAFDVDQQGKLNARNILRLRRLEITDERWQRAMRAIAASVFVASSKKYIRFYERDAIGAWKPISLDIAAL